MPVGLARRLVDFRRDERTLLVIADSGPPALIHHHFMRNCATDQTYFYELRGIRRISGIPSTPISTPYDPKSRTLSVYSLGTTIYQRELGITMNTISQVDIHTHNRSNTD
jgi:hypothetical protein